MSKDGYALEQEVVKPVDPDQSLIGDIAKGKRRAQANKDRRKMIQPEMRLWAAVIKQAVEDLTRPNHDYEARKWFLSNEFGPGSLLWICQELNLNVLEVRSLALIEQEKM